MMRRLLIRYREWYAERCARRLMRCAIDYMLFEAAERMRGALDETEKDSLTQDFVSWLCDGGEERCAHLRDEPVRQVNLFLSERIG